MPWQEVCTMSLRLEFVTLAMQEEANVRDLCRRFGISPKTGYKWLERYCEAGSEGLKDRSRRPRHTPRRTSQALEQQVIELRQKHPAWGARKLKARLEALEVRDVPSASTITAILRRHELLDPDVTAEHKPVQRFEHAHPNDLWQLDFKGYVTMGEGRCHPLSVLDDHSRFLLALRACANQQEATVKVCLTECFRRYGLPWRILADNGPPWGASGHEGITGLEVWLLRLDIPVSHGRVYHPETQGKVERFHGTLKTELLRDWRYRDLADSQEAFDVWRDSYNLERPHEALNLGVPAARYRHSPRPFPEVLPPVEYAPGTIVRKVQADGCICYRNHEYHLSKGLRGQPVALHPTNQDGVLAVYFSGYWLGTLDLTTDDCSLRRRAPQKVS